MVDTIGAQPISTVHCLIKGINQALLLGIKFCLSNLTTQGLDIFPGRVKLLLDAWVHNGVSQARRGRSWGFQNQSQPYEVTAGGNTHLKVVAQLQYTMASSKSGRKLNPYRSLREPLGVKGVRQSVVITNNPSSIDQNQQLLVRFPNIGKDNVIVPGNRDDIDVFRCSA